MRILLTGGAGFVGSHLAKRLIADGHTIVCVDNLITGNIQNVASLMDHPSFQMIVADLNEALPLFQKVDQIYHLASPASPVAYSKYPIETLTVNAEGTRKLLEYAEANSARFLFASTSEVYGDPLVHPQAEGYFGNVSTTGPRSMYDEAKRYGEALSVAYGSNRDIEVRIARIFNTYGPNMARDDGRVVSNFIVQALQQQPITIYGDGSQSRSFQYIDDLIEGLAKLMASNVSDPVNLGNPHEVTVGRLAEIVIRMCEANSTITYLPLPKDDPTRRRPDITLAMESLNWSPLIPLETGLQSTIDYFVALLAAEPAKQESIR